MPHLIKHLLDGAILLAVLTQVVSLSDFFLPKQSTFLAKPLLAGRRTTKVERTG
jgi:hypothetical protein